MADGSKVVKFYTAALPDHVLERAVGDFQDVLVIGWDKDGDLDVRSNAALTHEQCLWLVEQFKSKLLAGDYSPIVE